uniref:R3H domain containing 1 n=1 Tax=Salarias fasciatus TaxID=181472 RepID=A0A672FDN1_SALFA
MRMSDAEASRVSQTPDTAAPPPPAKDSAAAAAKPEEHSPIGNSSGKTDAQSNARLKLVRSLAVCEESFPCLVPQPSPTPQQDDAASQQQGGDGSSSRKPLSRDSSQDYTDSTGIDLHEFLVNTLKGNPRDRVLLLKLEQDILDFISNNDSQRRRFPPMTSYHRMLLHRVAAYFGMEHNVDPSGKAVVINKTSSTRIPDQKFSDHVQDDSQQRYILKRDDSGCQRHDDATIRMRLKADRRSKSMEEREEEYQRARERIFAHDGSDHFLLDRSTQDEDARLNSQQRRQMFRLRSGRSGASRHSSSETDSVTAAAVTAAGGRGFGEPRPWSSTDSSDSCQQPPHRPPRPAFTKARSFSGLARGDSTASSAGRLSKTGSESCSSVGSSSSSLSRPQLPLLPAPAPPPLSSQPDTTAKSAAVVPPPPPAPADVASYFLLPLDASGIPPGSVLIHPHTGKPFLHPDAVMYGAATRVPQQGKATANQLHSQPDALNAQFSHMTLTQHPPNDSVAPPDGRHHNLSVYHPHHSPSPVVLQGATQQQQQQQVAGYVVTGPSGGHPAGVLQGQSHAYSSPAPSGSAHPAFPQLAFIQQPVQQISTCYCSSAHQQQQQYYRPLLPYNCPNLPQQQVHQAVMPTLASGYQPAPGLSLAGNQQSNTGNQMQGMMVQYPPMQPYQQVSVPQQTYQQPVMVSCQPGGGAVQPCYSLLPPNQHATMSSTVSFLPPSMMDQLQFPQPPPPCVSQQHPGQQYAGLLAPPPGGIGGGMLMLQMTSAPGPAPQQQQQPRPLSPCQRKPPGRHLQRAPDLLRPPPPDPAQSSPPSPGNKGVLPVMAPLPHPTAFCHSGQGEPHLSFLGQPLQLKPSVHAAHVVAKHQGALGVWRSGPGKKSGRKPLSSHLSVRPNVPPRKQHPAFLFIISLFLSHCVKICLRKK